MPLESIFRFVGMISAVRLSDCDVVRVVLERRDHGFDGLRGGRHPRDRLGPGQVGFDEDPSVLWDERPPPEPIEGAVDIERNRDDFERGVALALGDTS